MEPGPYLPQRSAGPRDASGLASRLRQPATSRQLPPACPAVGRFQCLKIALEETQVWGSRREMSLRRAANSTHRHTVGGVQWAGNTPWRSAPATRGEPAQEPPSCCSFAAPDTGRGRVRSAGGSDKVWAAQKSAGAHTSRGDTLLLLGYPVCAHAACTLQGTGGAELAVTVTGAGYKHGHRVLRRRAPGRALPQPRCPQGCVWGGPESTVSQTSPLIMEQKAFLWRRAEQGTLWGRPALS